MESLLSGLLPTLLIAIIGYFLNRHFEDAKDFQSETKLARINTTEKLDKIITSLNLCNTEIAVIEANLNSHIKADETVQKAIDDNINKIHDKLEII